ncbi:MAG: DUF2007 domain-containing protein [bacterium]|nr:DUF2007 domain-containing protein [bacterium]
MAPNLAVADMIKGILDHEGILVMLRSLGPPHFGPSAPVEVLVPRAEVRDALEVLEETLSGP